MGLLDSGRISRVRPYLRTHPTKYIAFTDGAITHYGGTFQSLWLTMQSIANSARNWETCLTTPPRKRLAPIAPKWFRLFPFRSPLLRESRLISFPQVLRCFSSLCVLPQICRVTPHYRSWVPPFGNPRVKAYLTARRGLSQLVTSFIGTLSRGIHSLPFLKLDCNVQPLTCYF
ncbi:MAG: hypothetical protein UW70_C0016G0012 [Candidatus Peregrinibacteria bacterium GW2011_GWA2_44_7]|nr:MAG: hypothetical protein UW70_C0016G0012 [Candidatus Peregrinibacteria bacterium GW2011_GWA2_44_7]